MEINASILEWQGIFQSVYDSIGDISKIKYQRGHDKSIKQIIDVISDSHLLEKYIVEGEYSEQIENIVTLFIANTKLNEDNLSNFEEYSHIVNIMPLLSTCVLTNIVLEFNLLKHYCKVVCKLPVQVTQELLNEIVSSLKFCKPDDLLKHTYECCKCIIEIILNHHNQNTEKLNVIFGDILGNLTSVDLNKVEGWKKSKVYELMGNTIFVLLKLILKCSLSNTKMCMLLDKLIRNSLDVFNAVTVRIFCIWAEVKHKSGQSLQVMIAGQAYCVIEHLGDYKPAKELIQKLKVIAKRPKSISDLIETADTETIINNVDQCDKHQYLWFQALLNNANIFENEKAMQCVKQWSTLCSSNDVANILIKSLNYPNWAVKELFLKCTQHLNAEEAQLVVGGYFNKTKLTTCLNVGVSNEELNLLLNKITHEEETNAEVMKNIYLFFLQNAEHFLIALWERCLKKSIYVNNAKNILSAFKTIPGIHDLIKDITVKMLEDQPPSVMNVECYKELMNVLINCKYLYDYVILCEIFIPYLERLLLKEEYETVLHTLHILNLISMQYNLRDNMLTFVISLINITDKLRYNFASFSIIKQLIIEEAVQLLQKYRQSNEEEIKNCLYKDVFLQVTTKDPLTKFYTTMFYDYNENNLLAYTLNEVSSNEEFQITALIMVLQKCSSSEWLSMVKQMVTSSSYEESLEKLVDIFRMFHAMADASPDNQFAANAFKFYLNQYAIIIKDVFQPKQNTFENQLLISKKVNATLAFLNEKWRSEALQIIELLSKESLKSLSKDKQFIITLMTFKDPVLAKTLSGIMLSQQ